MTREWCVDLVHLFAFLTATQPETREAALDLANDSGHHTPQFLPRLFSEIGKRGVIDVLRHGIKHGQHDITLFYGTPSPRQRRSRRLCNAQNRFSVTRQLALQPGRDAPGARPRASSSTACQSPLSS